MRSSDAVHAIIPLVLSVVSGVIIYKGAIYFTEMEAGMA